MRPQDIPEKTAERMKGLIDVRDNPRLRGELRFHLLGARFLIGSSPLARGTLLLIQSLSKHVRFIPACAGNSVSDLIGFGSSAVHPRLRGELT